MKFIAAIATFVLASLAAAQTPGFTVITPQSLVACQPFQITWTGGTAPYFPRIVQGGQLTTILEQFNQTSSNALTWTVNQPAGTVIQVIIVDSQGLQAQSGMSNAIAAGSTSCLGQTSVVAGPTSTGAGATSSTGTGSVSRTTSTTMGGSSTGGTTSAPTSSTSRPATTSSAPSSGNGASTVRGAAAVAAGVVGCAVAALL